MFIVDNNNVLSDYPTRCLLCPSYEYRLPYDILRSLDDAIYKKEYQQIAKTLNGYGIAIKNSDTPMGVLADFYMFIGKEYRAISQKRNTEDQFWLLLANRTLNGIRKGYTKEALLKYAQQVAK
jgi:hypothetical protein